MTLHTKAAEIAAELSRSEAKWLADCVRHGVEIDSLHYRLAPAALGFFDLVLIGRNAWGDIVSKPTPLGRAVAHQLAGEMRDET